MGDLYYILSARIGVRFVYVSARLPEHLGTSSAKGLSTMVFTENLAEADLPVAMVPVISHHS